MVGAALGVALGSLGGWVTSRRQNGGLLEERVGFGVSHCRRKEVARQISGSRQRRGKVREAGLEAFPLPGEQAPGCSWLLAGAINLAASRSRG